jgi:hypothetical protein
MHHDLITFQLCPGSLVDIRLPWLLIVRLERQPPGDDEKKDGGKTSLDSPARTNQKQTK